MSYVVYNLETTRVPDFAWKHSGIKYYATLGAAKAALTRAAGRINKADYGIADSVDFHNSIEKTIIKRNLMSGKEYQEPVNTPLCCSPSSETYWSM